MNHLRARWRQAARYQEDVPVLDAHQALPPGWTWGWNRDGELKVIPPAITYSRVMPAAQAEALGWHGPVYHGTSTANAAKIRQGGFKMPRLDSWQYEGWGNIEEVIGGDTIVVWFAEKREDADGYGGGGPGTGEVVTAYLRPGGFRVAGTFGLGPALVVDDVANVVVVSDR